MHGSKDYEKALTWLYRAEIADPGMSLKDDLSSKIVNCLERLERFSAAQYALDARAGVDRSSKAKEDESETSTQVVARIGDEEISMGQLDEKLDRLPPWLKEEFDLPAKKEEFLRQYVAEELLVRKALKLEMDKDPEVRRRVEDSSRRILVE